MAHMITLLDIGGKPTQHFNADLVTRVSDRVEQGDPVIVHLRGDSIRTGQDVSEVLEIINSGETPEYELDENGVLVGYLDPRFKAQRAKEAAATAAAQPPAPDAASAGFGADVPPAVGEADADKSAANELPKVKTANNSFGRNKK